MALARSGGLQPLPGLVYALLRSPLLSRQPPPHADSRAAADHLWGWLPPDQLRCAIYPVLASYTEPNTLVSLSVNYSSCPPLQVRLVHLYKLDSMG